MVTVVGMAGISGLVGAVVLVLILVNLFVPSFAVDPLPRTWPIFAESARVYMAISSGGITDEMVQKSIDE